MLITIEISLNAAILELAEMQPQSPPFHLDDRPIRICRSLYIFFGGNLARNQGQSTWKGKEKIKNSGSEDLLKKR
jgi:hypothetical protein